MRLFNGGDGDATLPPRPAGQMIPLNPLCQKNAMLRFPADADALRSISGNASAFHR